MNKKLNQGSTSVATRCFGLLLAGVILCPLNAHANETYVCKSENGTIVATTDDHAKAKLDYSNFKFDDGEEMSGKDIAFTFCTTVTEADDSERYVTAFQQQEIDEGVYAKCTFSLDKKKLKAKILGKFTTNPWFMGLFANRHFKDKMTCLRASIH